MGRVNIDIGIRLTLSDGLLEFAVFKVERADSTPSIGTHPVPSAAEINSQGMQQAVRMANPGKTYHFSQRTYSIENTVTHKIIVSPAKFRASKWKAGDHLMLMIFNRGPSTLTYDMQARYKEYE